ncbi:MAG TPA: hypothetical protein VFL13_12725 [Candidatus Baltobacteraceae bacterium]|nr:hypothetical protein [Candidatus Baltobacteraceae bacterium]
MISADQALITIWNRTSAAYASNAPVYITYDEYTHATATIGQQRDVNRHVAVRQADNFAVMRDLPDGGERSGQAFPFIPYFDPLSNFSYSWRAPNAKILIIDLARPAPGYISMPAPDPNATMSLPYFTTLVPTYLPDTTQDKIHLRVELAPNLGDGLHLYDIVADAHTGIPSHVELRSKTDTMAFDYQIIEGHWVVTHASYTTPIHFGPFSYTVSANTDYKNIAFPAAAPDPRLAGTPGPIETPSGQ